MPPEATADPWLAYRERFPILARTNYLISNSLGAVPASARDRLLEYYETWACRGVRAWEEGWWEMAAGLGALVAPLIGGQAVDVVFQPNVTLAHAILISGFDYRAGRPRIVTDAMHFPSILYLLAEQAALGAEVVVVPSDDGVTIDAQRVIDTIDERTAFVAVSHVLYGSREELAVFDLMADPPSLGGSQHSEPQLRTGCSIFKSAFIQDAGAIAGRARRVGAISIIDGYQSVGVIPVDVERDGFDAYVGGCLKWLCGGPGAAFLWTRPDFRVQHTPRITGWMSHARPFGFEPRHEPRADAWRHLVGTPNISALYAARPGLEIINEVGPAAIRAKSIRQTARLLVLADRHGYRCTTPRDPDRRGGTVALDVDHGLEVARALKAREILCDYRPGAGIRLSPHFYTRDDDLDAAVDAIADIFETGDWRRFEADRPTVT